MRIGQFSGLPTSGSSGKSKIGNVSLPDYNDFSYCTKTTSSMSDDKFKEAIAEQAKKDQAAGKYQNSVETRRLQKQYVSVVSPDRKGLITDGLTKIFKNKNPQPKTLNLIDLIFGEAKYEKVDGKLNYAEFYDNNGDHVASYSNGGWTFYGTKAEFSRESEFCGIYREAWGNAAKAASIPTVYDSGNSLNIIA